MLWVSISEKAGTVNASTSSSEVRFRFALPLRCWLSRKQGGVANRISLVLIKPQSQSGVSRLECRLEAMGGNIGLKRPSVIIFRGPKAKEGSCGLKLNKISPNC